MVWTLVPLPPARATLAALTVPILLLAAAEPNEVLDCLDRGAKASGLGTMWFGRM